ncbi:MAG TPA: efflux RND transporter periplasmic adaptor subunit [Anaeromyxobacter sp.]|nr:efflux RND transporter periplasmic adaptor subunit [Anaeromyxobacter sp.]
MTTSSARRPPWKRLLPLAAVAAVALAAALVLARPRTAVLVLTGIVTTDDVVVGPQVAGRVDRLLVREGDVVARDQLLAQIEPAELEADRAYFTHSAEGYASQVEESAAALRFQERETAAQVAQAEAGLAAAEAQRAEAGASLEDARLTLERQETLARGGASPAQDLDHARTAFDVAQARTVSLDRQVEAQRAALALARANGEQVLVRRSALRASEQQRAAADAQRAKAGVRLGYAEIRAPIAGVVDVRAARLGEYVNPGQAIVTLIDPDDLWVRADVEESYIDRIHLGDRLTVRLPSGEERQGTVIRRGVDAAFATQRDVSRTKRDIRTFEVRLRVDNRDRALAVGMTAYVLLPVPS